MNYKELEIEEIRAERFSLETLAESDFNKLERWQTIGKDENKPLYRLAQPCQRTEIKFKDDPSIYEFIWFDKLVTDKGSVPDFVPDCLVEDSGSFWDLLAYCIHDGLYSNQNYSRLFADNVLRAIENIGKESTILSRRITYRSVRLGGWLPWKKRNTRVLDIVRKEGFVVRQNDKFKLRFPSDTNRRLKLGYNA